MTKVNRIPRDLAEHIAAVRNKRARFVLDAIAKKGMVTTEEINQAGYEHPPRAVRDARELGFPIRTIKVKHSNGRTIAAYIFPENARFGRGKSGRRALTKKQRDAIIDAAACEGVRSAEGTRTCRLTTAFPMRLLASLMGTMRRYSWFCAGHAIAKNHGAVSTARTGPASVAWPFAKHAIGWDELITCMSRWNSSAGPMSSGEKIKSKIMRGFTKRRGGQRRQFPNTSSSYCGTASRKAKPVMRNHREIKPIFDERQEADGRRTRIPRLRPCVHSAWPGSTCQHQAKFSFRDALARGCHRSAAHTSHRNSE